jgi:hypothetical protein
MWTRTTARGMENEPENRLVILKSCDGGVVIAVEYLPTKNVLVQSRITPRPAQERLVPLMSHHHHHHHHESTLISTSDTSGGRLTTHESRVTSHESRVTTHHHHHYDSLLLLLLLLLLLFLLLLLLSCLAGVGWWWETLLLPLPPPPPSFPSSPGPNRESHFALLEPASKSIGTTVNRVLLRLSLALSPLRCKCACDGRLPLCNRFLFCRRCCSCCCFQQPATQLEVFQTSCQ